jgi:hypothetical protein
MTTPVHAMDFDSIRTAHRLQGAARMARLTAAFLLMAKTVTLRRWFSISIARWWFSAVAAILRQDIFEVLYPFFQKLHVLKHLLDEGDYRIFSLAIDSPNFGFCQVWYMVHTPLFSYFFR